MPTAASQLRTPNVARDRLPHLLPFLTINNDKLQFYNVPVNWHWTDPAIGTGAGGGIINGPCESSSNNGGEHGRWSQPVGCKCAPDPQRVLFRQLLRRRLSLITIKVKFITIKRIFITVAPRFYNGSLLY